MADQLDAGRALLPGDRPLAHLMTGNNRDVSRRALSIARVVDRLGPGQFLISLKIPEHSTERWVIEITQPVTVVQRREIYDKPEETKPE